MNSPSLKIEWSGKNRPDDEPSCGFNNELCKKDDTEQSSIIVAIILGLTLFCAIVVTLSIYRKWKIELEIEGLLWKIDPSDLLGYHNKDIVSSPSKVTAFILVMFHNLSNSYCRLVEFGVGYVVRIPLWTSGFCHNRPLS